jgi:3-oxoacyl-[acyl-carrier protein] reductase
MSRVALVTGGGRGIGLGVSRALLGEGFSLAFCGMREASQVASLDELEKLGEVHYVQADVSSTADRERLVESVVKKYGRIDLLINNAGVAPTERLDLLEASEDSYDRVMNINLKGPYFLTQAVARVMVEQASDGAVDVEEVRGTIVFVSSISATVPSVNRGEYCLSKAGLSMATKLWSTRLADDGILVYELRPGITETDMTSGVKEKYDALIADGLLLQKRWGTPVDIGKAVASIARGDLSYSTGQVITIDGGLTRTVL